MKKALVLGATGGIGFALVRELSERGIAVVAFARKKEKLKRLFQYDQGVTIYSGDVLTKGDILDAAAGADVIFHAVSFPYQEWKEKHLACLELLIQAAEKEQTKIVLADNIYAYGRQPVSKTIETTKKKPHTRKGKIRLEMESRLKSSKVPSLIVHLPDLYGPNAENTILYETLKKVNQNKPANYIGSMQIAREFLYTADGAKAMIELSLRNDAFNQNWNIPAAHPITGEDILAILRREVGYQKCVRTVSKNMIRFIGLFQPAMREVVEMMYLTEEPVVLSGRKYETEIGPVPKTPYQVGLIRTLDWMKMK